MAVVSGGTTLIDNGALDAAVPSGSLTLLSTQTASASATISFTSGIDSTYDSYVFKFYDIHPSATSPKFTFQADTGTNTNYNQTITSTSFNAYHSETDSSSFLGYVTDSDQAQGTAFNPLSNYGVATVDDSSLVGSLHIFNPASTTFVKHFIANTQMMNGGGILYSVESFHAGYFNTTTALTRFQFKFDSGNIDSGTIKMYGVK